MNENWQKSQSYPNPILDPSEKPIKKENVENEILKQAPFCWLIAGTKKSGKTYMLSRFLLQKNLGLNFFSHIILISPSAEGDLAWIDVKKHYGEKFQSYLRYTEDDFSLIISYLSLKEGEKLVIVDDCEGSISKAWNANSGLVQAYNGIIRKAYISIVTLIQNFSLGMNPGIKNQADIISIFNLGSPKQYASLMESLGVADEKSTLQVMLAALSQPYSFVTIIKTPQGKKLFYKFTRLLAWI